MIDSPTSSPISYPKTRHFAGTDESEAKYDLVPSSSYSINTSKKDEGVVNMKTKSEVSPPSAQAFWLLIWMAK
jgi:hypothetical protein